MLTFADAVKRVLVGRPFRSERLHETLLPKRIALPVFASDALSSVAYAPNEIFLTLAAAGLGAYVFSWQIGIAVAVVMIVVVLSYRQNVHAYPSGGGDYEVATVNLGASAGLTVASALLVDYVLTVAVSISSAAQYASSAIPALRGHEATAAVIAVLVLTTLNLRGVRESGTLFAVPTYVFMFSILGMGAVGAFRLLFGDLPVADSARFDVVAASKYQGGLATLAGFFLILRAFSSGCAALTGVEAISNGVPAFKKPKSRNAATTLALLGALAVAMMMSILLLARATGVRYVDETAPWNRLLLDGQRGAPGPGGSVVFPDGTTYHQLPIIGQLAADIFSGFTPAFLLVTAATGVILVLAANTAFNGFPVLGSILARDGYLPRQLHTRGDRLAFSNGIIMLAGAAVVLIVAFDAQVTRLIQLYIVGVFVSFTMSQTGMVRHWTRLLRTETNRQRRLQMMRSRVINSVGLGLTGLVLVVVLITKFIHGAWIAILAMVAIFVLMRLIRAHYDHVARELAVAEKSSEVRVLPSRVHAVVLISKIHLPALRALAYARASRPSVLEAVTVTVDPDDARALQRQWSELGIPVPLKSLDSPYREISRPIVEYVKNIRRESPRDLVVVYVPEYVVGHWWEQVLHNQSALRLKSRLHFTPGVVIASVAWQLRSSRGAEARMDGSGPGQVRMGSPAASGAQPLDSAPVEQAPDEPDGADRDAVSGGTRGRARP
ncbi:MAG: APC family permease [Actinomycetes bacterium]